MNDRLTTDPADPDTPVSARIRYLEEWIRDCQSYNRNVDARYVAALADADDQRALVQAKNLKLKANEHLLEALSASLDEARGLLSVLVGVEDLPCRLDHHGYCQEHPGGFADGGCVTRRARQFLRLDDPTCPTTPKDTQP